MLFRSHITVLGSSVFRDLMDSWESPVTEFMTSSAILKEAVEDLEWPQGPLRVLVNHSPFGVTLTSEGGVGSLEIALPAESIKNAVTQGGCTRFAYAYKFMKSALVGLSGSKGTSSEIASRVLIDANGLLKVVHMVSPGAGAAIVPVDLNVQHTQTMSTSVVLTYVVQPMFEDEVQN